MAPFSSTLAVSTAHTLRTSLSLHSQPFRIGIIGGGPAGFYAASRLLALPGSERTHVDVFELLPVPFGLARFGVAPDHAEVKNCQHKFEETALDPRFTLYGNVSIGSPSSPFSATIPLPALQPHYDALLLSYGASLDRTLSIPGEHLPRVFSARSFVNYYNGHPLSFEEGEGGGRPKFDLENVRHVTIVGQGNVALDVARILLKPVEELRETDLPEEVLEMLTRSRVERVEIVGRRGPLQLAGTTKELREMLMMEGVGFEMDEKLLEGAMFEVGKIGDLGQARMRKRAMGLLKKGSKTSIKDASKSWSLGFLQSPTKILSKSELNQGGSMDAGVGAVEFELNELIQKGKDEDPTTFVARGTGNLVRKETDMVMKSVGYRSVGIPGLPFDEKKGVAKNDGGRILNDNGDFMKGMYTSGWLSRGPNGVIATTMYDAFATADLIASDLCAEFLATDQAKEERPPLPMEELRGGKKIVSWQDWEKLDRIERERGAKRGKEREKVTRVKEMLELMEA